MPTVGSLLARNRKSSIKTIQKENPHLSIGNLKEVEQKSEKPPTYFKVNEFVWPFQELV